MTDSKDSINIRTVRQDDIETLFDIRTSVVENHQSREEIAELGITPESVAKMLTTDCCAWIAEIEDRSIGFSIANATEKTILGMFILPDFEGQGVGRTLMQAAESWLWSTVPCLAKAGRAVDRLPRSKGIKEIWLVTGNDPNLRAYGFYQHLGWNPVGVETEGDFKGEMKFIKKRG